MLDVVLDDALNDALNVALNDDENVCVDDRSLTLCNDGAASKDSRLENDLTNCVGVQTSC